MKGFPDVSVLFSASRHSHNKLFIFSFNRLGLCSLTVKDAHTHTHTYAQSPLGLRTGHVNLITWPRAVWDTWGYRIRPTARRGARSALDTKEPVFPPSAPPISVVLFGNSGSLQCKPSVNEVAQSKGGDLVWINLIRLECPSLLSLLKVDPCLKRLEEVEGVHRN